MSKFIYKEDYDGWYNPYWDRSKIGKIGRVLEREEKVEGSYVIVRVLEGESIDLIHYFNGDGSLLQCNLDSRLNEMGDSDLEKLARRTGLNLEDLKEWRLAFVCAILDS